MKLNKLGIICSVRFSIITSSQRAEEWGRRNGAQKEELPKVELCPISIGKSGSPFSEQLLLLSESSGYRGTALKDNSHGTLLLETA